MHLARNFGQGAALTACLDHVQGNPIIVMDADMQDSPGAFGLFLEKWRAGYAVVYAVRSSREEKAVMQALVWLFYCGLRWLANIDIPLDCGNFGLLDRSVVEALRRLPERNVYFPGLRAWAGFRQTGVKVP
ncbi:MAG: glycosyltransferase, partial [Candidatus Hydrogenedentes bacterium]|nr:glycosyltransferase [Candidatus Hydrogenedentota bacterium]